MKFKVVLCVILLLVILTGCGAQNNEIAATEPAASVNSEIDNNADTNLVRIKTIETPDEIDYAGDSDSLFNGSEFLYNDEGELDKYVHWAGFEPRETEYKYIYEYYENDKIKLSQRYENIDGQYVLQQELKFDENGYIYEQVTYSGGIDRRQPDYNFYTYDADGNLIKDEHYYDLDEIDSVKTYKYDNNGKLIESTYTEYINLTRHSVFYYNDFGCPSAEVEYDLNMNLECLYLYSYEYDYDNLPVKADRYKVTNPTDIEKIMSSAQFPLIDVRDNDAGVYYKKEDAMYVRVFNYEYLAFTKQQEEILLAKKKAYIDTSMWGYSFDGDLFN